VYAANVDATAQFYERLGFARTFQLPPEGEPGYVSLLRGSSEVAVVERQWPVDQHGIEAGTASFEMFVYVPDADAAVAALRAAGVRVLREPADMAWGERVGFVLDPDGNPVALATAFGQLG
jgi:lactoylglutathione lyase